MIRTEIEYDLIDSIIRPRLVVYCARNSAGFGMHVSCRTKLKRDTEKRFGYALRIRLGVVASNDIAAAR